MIALDTNILIYAITDDDTHGRHQLATRLLEKLAPCRPILPLQVVGEFLNVCRKRKRVSFTAAMDRADHMMRVYYCVPSTAPDFLRGATTSHRYKLDYFDALILTVARRAGATFLLSEDMQDGMEVEGLKIINPFVPANETLLADLLGSAL